MATAIFIVQAHAHLFLLGFFLLRLVNPRSGPEHIKCKCCGSRMVVPPPIRAQRPGIRKEKPPPRQGGEESSLGRLAEGSSPEKLEARLYLCQVCGDNWLTVKEVFGDEEARKQEVPEGTCRVSFYLQKDTRPSLRRYIDYASPALVGKASATAGKGWVYEIGGERVEEGLWKEHLKKRRDVLRSTAVN